VSPHLNQSLFLSPGSFIFKRSIISAMRKIFLSILLLFILGITANAQSKDEISIRKMLKKQTVCWNSGDIKTFMNTYWQSDSLMFIGKSGITYGWQKTLDNYKKNYADTVAMGKLDFNLLEIKKLSADYFLVVGKWHLSRSIGDLAGIFTLLFRKIKNQWFIIADHSS
jgi:ketosteroid isomerase-like protein